MKLSDVTLRRVKATDKPQKFADGGGLYLYVAPTGGKLWRMDYRFEGKRKTLSFGAYPAVGLKDARARREEAKGQIAAGIDPEPTKRPPKKPPGQIPTVHLRSLRENGSIVRRMVGLKATPGRLWRGLREIFFR